MTQVTTTHISDGVRVRCMREIGIVDIEIDLDSLQGCAAISGPLRAAAIRELEGLVSHAFSTGYIERRVWAGIASFTQSRLDAGPHAVGISIAATTAGLAYARDHWDKALALLSTTAIGRNEEAA